MKIGDNTIWEYVSGLPSFLLSLIIGGLCWLDIKTRKYSDGRILVSPTCHIRIFNPADNRDFIILLVRKRY